MGFANPPHSVVALAAFVRQRLSELSGTIWGRGKASDSTDQLGTVVVGAAGPFAPNSYARARLLRQLHAGGLLSEPEAERSIEALPIAR